MRLLAAFVVFLALVRSGPAQTTPPADRYVCTPPAGITLHLTNPQLMVDSTGRVFCATRGKSGSQGGIVWTMDGDQARILIPLDPHRFNANGEFTMIGGYLFYVSANDPPTRYEAIRVPEFTP